MRVPYVPPAILPLAIASHEAHLKHEAHMHVNVHCPTAPPHHCTTDRPHLPFVAPAAKFDLYPAAKVKLPADQQPPTGMPPVAWSNSGELLMYSDIKTLRNGSALQPGQVLPPDTVRELRRAYYSAVSHMDDQLGKVMAALEASGFKDETVVSFWGDHGWQLGEHGEWCKHTNFELATHAPMMIRVPGLTDKGMRTMAYTGKKMSFVRHFLY